MHGLSHDTSHITTEAIMQNVNVHICIQYTENMCYGNNILTTPRMVQNVTGNLKSGKRLATMYSSPNTLGIPIGAYLRCWSDLHAHNDVLFYFNITSVI